MEIPINSVSGYIGLALLALGGFMVLAGLDIISIQQVTVKHGRRTWGMGFVFLLGGIALVLPELQPPTSSTATPVPSTPVSVDAVPTDGATPAEPTAALTEASLILFRDDFNNALTQGWNILREDPQHWSLTDNPGSWRVTLQPGTVDGFVPLPPTNVLLREVTSGDFEIATMVHFTPMGNYQFAGLIVYQDDLNALQLGRSYCDRSDVCVGDGVYFDSTDAEFGNFAIPTSDSPRSYLRLRREGSNFAGYYSEDGESWTLVGQHASNINPVYVGLMAGQALEIEAIADFEYFTMEEIPSP